MKMSTINPAVPGATAEHAHGVPITVTATSVPGTVLFDKLPPLHIGDFWFAHYVPEWECAHPVSVITGALGVLCDNRPLACTGISSVMCGQITLSPVQNVIIKP